MTEQERDKAFRAATAAGVKGRTALLRNTRDEIVRLLKLAQEQIAIILASQPSDYQLWSLPQLSKEISRILATFGEQGSAVISTAAGTAWQAGIDLVDKPLDAGGVRLGAALATPDVDQLMAMRHFMTGRIANISTVSADAINSEMGLVVIGAQSPGDAITRVNAILGGKARQRATTIVRTELGRVFSAASFARMQQAVANGANIRKKWIKSGKVHSRPGHDAIHGEIKKVDEPFWVMGKDGVMHDLMFPRDPGAPASETINCGCVVTPTASGFEGAGLVSMVGKADGTTYTNAELRARAAARHPGGPGMQSRVQEAFDPNQPRDTTGKWTGGGSVDLAAFLAGVGDQPIVVASVPPDIKARLRATSDQVLLSRYTADKQKKHPEITAESYGRLQHLLNHGERLYDTKHHVTVIQHHDQPYVAVLKATKSGHEVYLQSFRRSDAKNVASLRKRSAGGG